ncbi:MAG: ABC transporter permease [Planctomycetota bacterium]|jgi:putative ABC transport system permease protein
MSGLVFRNLLKHPIRSLLTIGSLTIAVFLLCFLRTVVTTLESGVEGANSRRLWVQSAVSLFVDLPTAYQSKIEAVEGVERTCKWQWFGGYYKDPSNFFAQFAVDPEELMEIWPEVEIVAGSKEAFLSQQTSCMIGEGLANDFGWKVGDQVPIIGALFPTPDGSAYVFEVAAIYRPARATVDSRTFFFHWKFHEETQQAYTGTAPNVGVYVISVEPGADTTSIMATVDGLFENGPQVVQTTTEAEFNRQFVSMIGNVPKLLSFIGGGVFIAILLACVNTMLMAGREQVRDVGVMKALGFADGAMFRLLIGQSLALCGLGGGLGILLAVGTQGAFATALGRYFPGFEIRGETFLLAIAVTIAVGVLAGLVPGRTAAGMRAVEALRRQ